MSEYLPQDQDLLDELAQMGEVTTGMGDSAQRNRLAAIQIKSTLRNRKTASDLDKSTSRYSIILIAFAIVQIVVAVSQFLFDVETSSRGWVVFGVASLLFVVILFILRGLDPDKILKNGNTI